MCSLAFKIVSIFHQAEKPNMILTTVLQTVFTVLKSSTKSLLFPIICTYRNSFLPLSITPYFTTEIRKLKELSGPANRI